MRFVGVSTGRAGSVWISTVMNRAGLSVQHETAWKADGPDWRPAYELPLNVAGEWSAQIVPFLDTFPDDWLVVHQVRHPLKVIASYLRFGLFDDPAMLGGQGLFMERYANIVPGVDPVGQAARFVLEWNQACEAAASVRWQVETVTPEDIAAVASVVGQPVETGRVAEAMGRTRRTINNWGEVTALEWGDIPDKHRYSLQAMAGRYGYT